MIINYKKQDKFNCCVFIPDELPWKLEAVADSESDEGTDYALKLTAGKFEDVILRSEDFYDLVDTGEDNEDDAILALFSQITLAAAAAAAYAAVKREQIIDLSKVVQGEVEFWIKFYEHCNQYKKERTSP